MNIQNKFEERMKQRSNGELVEITTKLRNDYMPKAVEAAEQELNSRNLTTEQYTLALAEIEQKELSEIEKANKPLSLGQKLFFFVFYWGVIPWAYAIKYKVTGYTKQYKDAWKYMLYGFITMVLMAMVVFLMFYSEK